MLELAAPAWLAALAGLLLPLAIHLISRGRARRVRVGSVRLLRAGATFRARSLRLRDPLLLAVRAAFVAALALALAAPRWSAAPRPVAGTWRLVEPGVATATAAEDAPEALETRWLAPGLPRVGGAAPDGGGDLWSLVVEADLAAPPGVRFEVTSASRAERLRGARPPVDREIEWRVVAAPPNRWLERVTAPAEGRWEAWIGAGDAAGTRYERVTRASATDLALDPGGAVAADDRVVSPPSPRPLRVAVLAAAERREDDRYVVAAVRAAAAAGGFALDLARGPADAGAAPAAPLDLVFWLAAEPVPEGLGGLLAAGGTLVSDQLARHRAVDLAVAAETAGGAGWRLRRLGPVDGGTGIALWRAPTGEVALDARPLGAGRWLRLHSRLHPEWGDLVLDPAFPRWVLSLLDTAAGERVATSRRPDSEPRALAAAEALPADAGGGLPAPRRSRWPEMAAWLLVAALVAADRLLAARRER